MRFDHMLGGPVDIEVLNGPLPCPPCVGEAVHVKELSLYLVIVPVISEEIMQKGSLDEYLLVDLYLKCVRHGVCSVGDCIDMIIYRYIPMLDIILHVLNLVVGPYLICKLVKTVDMTFLKRHVSFLSGYRKKVLRYPFSDYTFFS